MTHEDNYDAERYESAVGWQPRDPDAKLRAAYRKKYPEPIPANNLLDVRPVNEWMQENDFLPVSSRLFDDLWKEGELSILFADTGTGKSILAVQIAESIARGRPALPTANGLLPAGLLLHTAKPQKVLYLDYELSEEQFKERYSRLSPDGDSYTDKYKFSDNFLRSQIKWDDHIPAAFKNMAEFMSYSVAARIREFDAKVLIVDNISYLNTSNVNANAALTLMKALKWIKSNLEVSILVLAHTPKRAITKPLTINDLAGSKMLANFADNMFAIGASIRDKDLRYIKQIKTPKLPRNLRRLKRNRLPPREDRWSFRPRRRRDTTTQ